MAQGRSLHIYFVPLIFRVNVSCLLFINYNVYSNYAYFLQIFHLRMPAEAVDLVSRLLQYSPHLRCSAVSINAYIRKSLVNVSMYSFYIFLFFSSHQLEVLIHPFFDELRDPNARLPNGRTLPPLFNFKPRGKLKFLSMPDQLKHPDSNILIC